MQFVGEKVILEASRQASAFEEYKEEDDVLHELFVA
jgi:hypothetical protein